MAVSVTRRAIILHSSCTGPTEVGPTGTIVSVSNRRAVAIVQSKYDDNNKRILGEHINEAMSWCLDKNGAKDRLEECEDATM